MTPLLAGFALGVAGSTHCVFMCGPLVLAVNGTGRSAALAVYQAARVTVYLLLGLAAGTAGLAAGSGTVGRTLSVAAGVVMLAAASGRLTALTSPAAGWWSRRLARGSAVAAGLGRRQAIAGRAMAGALNGLLRCGLVSAAVVAAAATGSPSEAALLMAGFGAGTVPALAVLPVLVRRAPRVAGGPLRRLAPVALTLAGAILIARGLVPSIGHGGHPLAPAREDVTVMAPHHR